MSTDWIVYHSTKSMGHTYSVLNESAVYSSTEQKKLCINDMIWVIEGDLSSPMSFTLVDCFKFTDVSDPPFRAGYSAFKIKISGESLLLKSVNLSEIYKPWFQDLHQNYLTKQRFFAQLVSEPEISKGLKGVSRVLFD